VIRARGLERRYGDKRVLRGLDFDLPRGGFLVVTGPNGAGKTTLLRMCAGLALPSAGTLEVEPDRSGIGFLGHEPLVYRELTALENLDLYGRLYRVPERRERIGMLLERFGLWEARRERASALSRGQLQRLALCRAVLHRPELLILDEPTSSLDPLNQQEFYALLKEARDDGATVFLSSHVLSEVQRVCDRVGIIRDGRLVQLAQLDEMRGIQVHHVEMTFAEDGDVPEAAVRVASGVEDVNVAGRHLTCTVRGSFDGLLHAIKESDVVELVSTEPSLEEVFLGYFTTPKPKALSG
jgi:ABC-2 type transport system ATP-binding protein